MCISIQGLLTDQNDPLLLETWLRACHGRYKSKTTFNQEVHVAIQKLFTVYIIIMTITEVWNIGTRGVSKF